MIDNRIPFAKFVIDHLELHENSEEIDWKLMIKKYESLYSPTEEDFKNKPGLMYINWTVSNHYGYNAQIVRNGEGRDREITKPRQIAHYVAREVYGYTFQQIGDFYGKDHATIIYSVKTVKDEMDTNKRFKEEITTLLDRFDYEKNKRRNSE